MRYLLTQSTEHVITLLIVSRIVTRPFFLNKEIDIVCMD